MTTTTTFRTVATGTLMPVLLTLTSACPALPEDTGAGASFDAGLAETDDVITTGGASAPSPSVDPSADVEVEVEVDLGTDPSDDPVPAGDDSPAADGDDSPSAGDDDSPAVGGEESNIVNTASCDDVYIDDPTMVVGSGNVAETVLTVSQATRIHVGDSFQGDLTVDPQHTGGLTLSVRADDNVLPYVVAELRGGVIDLGLNGSFCVTELSVKGTVGPLTELSTSGAARVKVHRLSGDAVTLLADGASHIEADGTAAQWDVRAYNASRAVVSVGDASKVALELANASEATLKGRTSNMELAATGASQLLASQPDFEAQVAGVELGSLASARLCVRDSVSGSVTGLAKLAVACAGAISVDGPFTRE